MLLSMERHRSPTPMTSGPSRSLRFRDEGHGYDVFGLDPRWVRAVVSAVLPVYRHWFRVRSEGVENVPSNGPVIIAANHGGLLPYDAAMLWTDLLVRPRHPRAPRAIADHFVPALPFVSTAFSRVGVVGGSRGNVHRLLEGGEFLLIFPEGTGGIGKPYRDRYQLQDWRVGHAELAIAHRAPVVPVAIVGPDEQSPLSVRIPFHALGAPFIPLSMPPFPLPVRYHILYGEPIALHERYHDRDDPACVAAAAGEVKSAVQKLIERGLSSREGLFR
jgi:1-acyl-sn-glycerol-3-phosphate acyltransferase